MLFYRYNQQITLSESATTQLLKRSSEHVLIVSMGHSMANCNTSDNITDNDSSVLAINKPRRKFHHIEYKVSGCPIN